MIIAIKIRLCHLLRGTTLTTNFGGKSIQVKPSVMHEACKRKLSGEIGPCFAGRGCQSGIQLWGSYLC